MAEPAPDFLGALAEDTKTLFQRQWQLGLAQNEPYLRFGWPRLDRATACLRTGTLILAGPPNYGKSATILNLYQRVLEHNEDVYVLDVTLDDDRATRVDNLIASRARMSIQDVKIAGRLPEELQARRKEAFQSFTARYKHRFSMLDAGSLGARAAFIETLEDYVRRLRDALPEDQKLFLVVDGIRNIQAKGMGMDYLKDEFVSMRLNQLAVEVGCICLASAQVNKDNRGRGGGIDAVKGGAGVGYDAKLIAMLFNDVRENGEKAGVWHERAEPEFRGQRFPVIELHIKKSKVSSFDGVIFYPFWPEQCRVEEAGDLEQEYYYDAIQAIR